MRAPNLDIVTEEFYFFFRTTSPKCDPGDEHGGEGVDRHRHSVSPYDLSFDPGNSNRGGNRDDIVDADHIADSASYDLQRHDDYPGKVE